MNFNKWLYSNNHHYNQRSWTFPSLQWFSCIYIFLSQSPIPISGFNILWSTFYLFRLDLPFLEFHTKKWPLNLIIKFLYFLKSQFAYHCENIPQLSLIIFSILLFPFIVLLCCFIMLLYIFYHLLNCVFLEGRDVFIHLVLRLIIVVNITSRKKSQQIKVLY